MGEKLDSHRMEHAETQTDETMSNESQEEREMKGLNKWNLKIRCMTRPVTCCR